MPESEIRFEYLGIGTVLARNSLRVHLNQREYSWTDREVGHLFYDLAGAITRNDPGYFLGTIVTIPREAGALEVVDGQQRLATTVILLAAIRNYLSGRDADRLIVEQIDNNFLSAISRGARARIPRLRLNVQDSDYFERRIVRNDSAVASRAQSNRLIDQAAKMAANYIRGIVAPHDEKSHGDVLNRWLDFIEHGAAVILLKVASGLSAFKMFETLNDRGLRTSQADLVKNYLFDEAETGSNMVDDAQQHWSSMKGVLESIDQDEDLTITYLRQILISSFGHIREPNIFETVQTQARGSSQAIQFLSMLDAGAANYAAMLNPAHQKWNLYPPSTRRAIEALILLRIKSVRPLVLSVMRTFDHRNTDLALRLILNIAVRFLIVGGGRSGTVEEGLAEVAKNISAGRIRDARDLLGEVEEIAPTDTEFRQEFAVATVSQAQLARYYLRSLEQTVKGEPSPYFIPNDDQTVINLEHILPKNTEGNWPDFSQEEADALYRRIGNLVLLQARQNSDLRSAPFTEKREVYRASPYELTRQVADVQEWNTDAIANRQEILAEIAVRTWPLAVA
jgi:hypothetical protein